MTPPVLHLADSVLDPRGHTHRPGAVLADRGRAEAWGPADDLRQEYAGEATDTRLLPYPPGTLLMPGLVNAHAHFELASIGPRAYTGSFTSWVAMLNERRDRDPPSIAASVRHAAQASLAAGIEAVGDIGGGCDGQDAAWDALATSGLRGVSFPELIGLGRERAAGELDRLNPLIDAWRTSDPSARMARGVSPHAPYSTDRVLFAACAHAAAEHGLPITTHLAETPEEAEFVAHATGPFREFMQQLGVWQPEHAEHYQASLTPVQWMRPFLEHAPWLIAHGNYLSDDDLQTLADTGTAVAYCPIASDYFGHHQGPGETHRYRDLLDAGVCVCLGTDSVVCQPPDEPQPHGLFAQLRHLHRRDATDPATLFRMATVHGRHALQLDDTVTRLLAVPFDPQNPVDPFVQALDHDRPTHGVDLGAPVPS